MRLYSICFCLIICVFTISAQVIRKSNDFPPPWKSGDMPKIDTEKFYLEVFQGGGKTIEDARESAIRGLISNIARSKGQKITVEQTSKIIANRENKTYNQKIEKTSAYSIHTDEFEASFELIDTYWEESRNENGTYYNCWALFEVALDPATKKFDKIQFSTNYGILPVLKSAIVPGWGQFSKMQKVKGLTIFGGEAALLGFGLVAENMRVDLITKMNNSRDVAFKKQCLDLANSWENGRNISFAAAGALYVYNIIDAAVSKGAKRYIYGNKVSLIPQYDQNSVGISLVCNLK